MREEKDKPRPLSDELSNDGESASVPVFNQIT